MMGVEIANQETVIVREIQDRIEVYGITLCMARRRRRHINVEDVDFRVVDGRINSQNLGVGVVEEGEVNKGDIEVGTDDDDDK